MRLVALVLLAFLLACGVTGLAWRYALRHKLLDVPNERSSHKNPTPRGGGVAIVLATLVALFVLAATGAVDRDLASALGVGGAAVAAVGYFDDRFRLSAGIRLAVHSAASAWALWQLGGVPEVHFLDHTLSLGVVGHIAGVMGLVWLLNLFNFMDGIDGIAAGEGTFIAVAIALVTWIATGGVSAVSSFALVLSAACLGFLLWNWPPAKIFMGDVGSGYIGYLVGVLALADARDNPAALPVWLILGGVFVVDATVTLLRRLARGERVYQAHRSHAYQWLARRWGSHARVTISVMLVNVLWLSPCAIVAALHPEMAVLVLLVALVPITVAAILAGAGRPETL